MALGWWFSYSILCKPYLPESLAVLQGFLAGGNNLLLNSLSKDSYYVAQHGSHISIPVHPSSPVTV
jgi:hypothetical protein